MKRMGVIFLLSLLMIALGYSQDNGKKNYQVFFSANPVEDSVSYWKIYIETRQKNSGFVIYDDMEYSAELDVFYVGNVQNTGQVGEVVYDVSIQQNGQWAVAGVMAVNKDDVVSDVGACLPKQISKKPGKPEGVGL
jgi:hypothetical protein